MNTQATEAAADPFSPDEYARACTGAAVHELARATRFGDQGLKTTGHAPSRHHFTAEVHHALRVEWTEEQLAGERHEKGNLLTREPGAYQKQIAASVRAEAARTETARDIASFLATHAFGDLDVEITTHRHPQRIALVQDCAECGGKGEVACERCDATGELECKACGGDGETSCDYCQGMGYTEESKTTSSGHEVVERVRCQHCELGYVSCHACDRKGRVKCEPCGGTGRLACKPCDATGILTRIACVFTRVKPAFVARYPDGTPTAMDAAIGKAGWAKLGKLATVRFDATRIQGGDVIATYAVSLDWCELDLELAGQSATCTLFGQPPRLHDAESLIERVIRADFERLVDTASWFRCINPLLARRRAEAVRWFMESEIHQKAVEASTQGREAAQISGELNGLLSEQYIGTSLRALSRVVRAMVFWSKASWLLRVCATAVLAVALFAWCLHVFNPDLLPPGSHITGRTDDMLVTMGVIGLPVAIAGWFLARPFIRRRVKRAGGERLVAWALKQGALRFAMLFLAMLVSCPLAIFLVYRQWPV